MLTPAFRAVAGKQNDGDAMVAGIPDRIMKLFLPCGKLASSSVLAAIVIFCALSKPADAQQTQGIAAQVDDDVITRLDLVGAMNSYSPRAIRHGYWLRLRRFLKHVQTEAGGPAQAVFRKAADSHFTI